MRTPDGKNSLEVDVEDDLSVEADTIDPSAKSLFSRVLTSLSPRNCWSPSACDAIFEAPDIGPTTVRLLNDLKKEGKLRSAALQQLYHLTDRSRKQNRLPMVCTTQFNIIAALIPCLEPSANAVDRRKALLLLANLAIPVENKAVILLTDTKDDLLPALLRIISDRLGECYLAMAVLFNLSYLEDAKQSLLVYARAPPDAQATYSFHEPNDNPYSVLRTLEQLLIDYLPYLSHSVQSVQSESMRWAMGTLRNLATYNVNAERLSSTRIPPVACQCLAQSSRDLDQWTRDSLEDASLMLLVHLASHPPCAPGLRQCDTTALEEISGQAGIHALRASVVLRQIKGEETSPQKLDEKKEELLGVPNVASI